MVCVLLGLGFVVLVFGVLGCCGFVGFGAVLGFLGFSAVCDVILRLPSLSVLVGGVVCVFWWVVVYVVF